LPCAGTGCEGELWFCFCECDEISHFFNDWSQNPAGSGKLATPDGCSAPDSYINQFYQQFWTDLLDEWLKTMDRPVVNTPEEFRDHVQGFYDKHSMRFVNDCAATSIDEDFAETFIYFVLEPKPQGHSSIE